jgi:hypothetical protein
VSLAFFVPLQKERNNADKLLRLEDGKILGILIMKNQINVDEAKQKLKQDVVTG